LSAGKRAAAGELQEAAALSGGGGLAGHLVGDAKGRYGALINRVKTPKQRGRTGGFTELLEGEEEAAVVQIGVEVRPAGPCTGELPWGGGAEEEKSSSERCEVERCSGRLL
jgi:hypothetical protein